MKRFFILLSFFSISYSGFSQWTDFGTGLPSGQTINCIFESNGKLFAGTTKGLYQSSGSTWSLVNNGLTGSSKVYTLIKYNTTLFAGTLQGFWYSSDNGDSWLDGSTGLPSYTYIKSIQTVGDTIFIASAGLINPAKVYKSSATSFSWKDCSSGLPTGNSSGANTLISTSSGLLCGVISTSNDGIYSSSNNGASWVLKTNSISAYEFYSVGSTVYDGYVYGVQKSDDNGNKWGNFSTGIPIFISVWSFTSFGNVLVAGTNTKGVYFTELPSGNWIAKNDGIPDGSTVTCLLTTGNIVYLGTGSGLGNIYKRNSSDFSATTSVDENTSVNQFSLLTNYPNPFNPETKISFNLAHSGNIRIQVFSLTGELIETLADGFYHQGTNHFNFTGNNLSSGIYFCRLQAGNSFSNLKMILAK